MADLIPAASGWVLPGGVMSRPSFQQYLVAPINQLAATTTPSAVLLARTTTVSVFDSVVFPLNFWETKPYDTGTITVAVASGHPYGGLLTVPDTGLYIWSASATWPNPTTGYRQSIYVLVNGSQPAADWGRADQPGVNGTGPINQNGGGEIPLQAGDTLQLGLFQNSGSTIAGVLPKTFGLARVA